MRKIPTLFQRDPDTHLVTDLVTPGCEWVLDGEGIPSKKLDGIACLVSGGHLFKRRELRPGAEPSAGFVEADRNSVTGEVVGWVPVTDGPEDAAHREAFAEADQWPDGTYELLGPKVQGNPEHLGIHRLIRHGSIPVMVVDPQGNPVRTFEGLRAYLDAWDMEGIVWHHPDGRMAKIKARDFRVGRGAPKQPTITGAAPPR